MTKWKRPSLETKFHIDYQWWTNNGKDIRVAVRGQLCSECQQRFPDHRNTESVDWVDPNTGEVEQADALLQCLRSECAHKPDFVSRGNPLITNVFRIFLLNGNQALTPRELHQHVQWQEPETILRTLAGGTVYMGLRPDSEQY
jgi:hypothetical protein